MRTGILHFDSALDVVMSVLSTSPPLLSSTRKVKNKQMSTSPCIPLSEGDIVRATIPRSEGE
jgi:hypothetical protein